VAVDPAEAVLREAGESGLALDALPNNTAKLRLILDLSADLDRPRAVLDVGCGGRVHPFELWEPFLPLKERLELVGVDVAHLEATAARARELGFPIEVRRASALELSRTFGADRFDAVVSTQVLEHLPDWRGALREMAAVLRPGGRLLVTCDSGDLARPMRERVRLAAKRISARLGRHEWERGPARDELREAARGLGLEVERLAWYGLSDVKAAAAAGGSAARLLALALEEAVEAEAHPGLYRLLYLRARKP
jgi:SAM-dependent methyltransferase